MLTALVAALLVSLTAIVTMNLVSRRFHLTAFGSDHAVALAASEGGVQYALARLWRDPTFESTVRNHIGSNPPTSDAGWYVLYPTGGTVTPSGQSTPYAVDEPNRPELSLGGKQVLVVIENDATPPRLRVRAFAEYATAESGF
jgi:hypothetical protein